MKKMEVKGLSVEDLEAKANQLKGELKKLEFNHSISPIENPNVIKEKKKKCC
jgi:large subunit ribosomal protein L29